MVSFGEGYVDIKFFTDVVANNLILKAFDEGMRAQLQIKAFCLAAIESNAVNGAQIVNVYNIAQLCCSICYFNLSCVLLLHLFQFLHNVFICYFCGNLFYFQTLILTQFHFRLYSYIADEFCALAGLNIVNIQSGSGNNVQTQFLYCCHVFIGEDVVDCIFIEKAFAILCFNQLSGYFTLSEAGQRQIIFVFVVSKSHALFQYFCAYFKRKFYCCFFFAD